MTIYCEGFKKKPKVDFIHVTDATEVLIRPDSKKLVVGTMISYKGRYLKGSNLAIEPSFDFFYPNVSKNGLWYFLSEVYSLKEPLQSKPQKIKFLSENKIAMVNLIQTALCEPENSDDAQIVIESLKKDITLKLTSSIVDSIYFTSINAKRLFDLWLTLNKVSYKSDVTTMVIDNRKFEINVLPSPTNRGQKGQTKPWKLAQYRKMFLGIN